MPAATYHGLPCPDCGGTERHVKRNTCVACYRRSKQATASFGVSNAPPRIKRPKKWPKFETAAGDTIQADPIAVGMGKVR